MKYLNQQASKCVGSLRQAMGALFLLVACGLSNAVFAANYAPTTFTDPPVSGAGITVNNSTGVITGGAGNTLVSLRSALRAADTLGGTHTLTLSTGTYVLTQALPNRQLNIGSTAQNITINGNGPANTVISMTNDANRDRIMVINQSGATNNVFTTFSGITCGPRNPF